MAAVATLAGWAADRMIAGAGPGKVGRALLSRDFWWPPLRSSARLPDSNSVALFFAMFSLSGLGLTTANYWALTQTILPGTAIGRVVGDSELRREPARHRCVSDDRLAEASHGEL